MTAINEDVIRLEFATEAALLTGTIKNGQQAFAKDTGALYRKNSSGILVRFSPSEQLSSEDSTNPGTIVIGSSGLAGVAPTGGSSGDPATLKAMLEGLLAYINSMGSSGSNIQYFDASVSSSVTVNIDTDVLINVGVAAGDIDVTLSRAPYYERGELVLVMGNMNGNSLTVDCFDPINGGGPVFFQGPAFYPFVRFRVVNSTFWQIIGQPPAFSGWVESIIYQQFIAVVFEDGVLINGDMFGIGTSVGVGDPARIPVSDIVLGMTVKGFVDFRIENANFPTGTFTVQLFCNGSAFSFHTIGPLAPLFDGQTFRYEFRATLSNISGSTGMFTGYARLYDLDTNPAVPPAQVAQDWEPGNLLFDISTFLQFTAQCTTSASGTPFTIQTISAEQSYSRPNT